MSDKDFKFFVPVELVKSEKDDEMEWRIQGIASTPDEDLQGETVDQEGLDISMLKAGRGLFNNDHQKGPENLLGEIEDAEFIDQNGKKVLMVKGYLFKHQERSKAFYNIMKSLKKGSSNRVQMSIEGKILQRDFANTKAIRKARIDKVALTLDPVNPYTYAELVKSLNAPEGAQEKPVEVAEEFVQISKSKLEKLIEIAQKAMSAGTGYAGSPGSMTGGAAMTKESLECSPKNVTYDKRKKKRKLIKSTLNECLDKFPDEDPAVLFQLVLKSIDSKLGDE